MLCPVLKQFPYSTDGVTTKIAMPDTSVELPAPLVPGLKREGFIGDPVPLAERPDRKMVETPAPENRALFAADENRQTDDQEAKPPAQTSRKRHR